MNRYANLVGTNRISDEYTKINDGFDQVEVEMDSKAPTNSPDLTGNPTVPNQAAGNNSTRAANTAYVDQAAGAVQTNLNNHAGNGNIHVTAADHTKLDGIQSGAQVNQNAFSTIAVPGQSNVVADAPTDTLNIEGGTGITITTNPSSDTVLITATGESTPGPHASSHITGGTDVIPNAVASGNAGLMSGTDKAAHDSNVTQINAATSSATANTIVKRDANSRFKSAAPAASDDVARRLEIETPPLITTTGTGAAYVATFSPAYSALSSGTRIQVKLHTSNTTTTPTINVNGLGAKTIVRPAGSVPIGLLKAAVYTLIYDGTNFTLQGEGGSGTAQPSQVLSGMTFSNDSGDQTGTMADRAGDTAALSSAVSGTTLRLRASEGYRDGTNDFVTLTDADFIAANIRLGINLFGIAGSLIEGKKFAQGNGTLNASGQLVVTGLSLSQNPSLIVVQIPGGPPFWTSSYIDGTSLFGTATANANVIVQNNTNGIANPFTGISASGFTQIGLGASYAGRSAYWIAFE